MRITVTYTTLFEITIGDGIQHYTLYVSFCGERHILEAVDPGIGFIKVSVLHTNFSNPSIIFSRQKMS